MVIFISVLILTLTYCIGSIPTGLLIGKVFYKKDLHNEGSGSTGATNSLRVLGKKAGIFVFLFDITKALIPALIVLYLKLPINLTIIAFTAVLGHCFPIFAHFKGGKAVATAFGFFAVFFPWPTTLGLLIFTISFAIFDMVSLSSLLAATTIFLYISFFTNEPIITKLFVFLVWALLTYRHSSNIKRLIRLKENKMVISLKYKLILTAITSIIIILSSLCTLATQKDNAALKNLFDQEISHLKTQTKNYEEVAKNQPSPKTYFDVYKSQVLQDAYSLISYDIKSTYSPAIQNDISEKLIVEYSFSTRINLNAYEVEEVYKKYNTQFSTLTDETKKKEMLDEMKTYLLQKYPASRTQGAPTNHISLQYTKVNNKWFLPVKEQVALINYLNSDVFVNNFSTSYIGSDENALSQVITDQFKDNPFPDTRSNDSLSEFANNYIQYLKKQALSELTYSINSSSKSLLNNTETLTVSYTFNVKTLIPAKDIKNYVVKKQVEINKLPEDQKKDAIRTEKQAIVDKFPKKQDTSSPGSNEFTLIYSRVENSSKWTLSYEQFLQFQKFVSTYITLEV